MHISLLNPHIFQAQSLPRVRTEKARHGLYMNDLQVAERDVSHEGRPALWPSRKMRARSHQSVQFSTTDVFYVVVPAA